MRCAWNECVKIVPSWMRESVDRIGKESLLELRLRLGLQPELVLRQKNLLLEGRVTLDDLNFCINAASRYSPWSAATISSGYITAPGGHRLGICGHATVVNHSMVGIKSPTSLCLRVARDFPDLAYPLRNLDGSILIIGKPGSGKTTLLRDLVRQKSDSGTGAISVVDEKGELFPSVGDKFCFPVGQRTDVLFGCKKQEGITSVLRNMSPVIIAVDEITAQEDCQALLHAGWCGVKLMATAHAHDREDLSKRSVYRPLLENKLFDQLIILQPDKSWRLERMKR